MTRKNQSSRSDDTYNKKDSSMFIDSRTEKKNRIPNLAQT